MLSAARLRLLRERFFAFLHRRYPPHAIATLALFALASVGYGAALKGAWPGLDALVIAVVVLTILSFQLAAADAVRDAAHADGVWQEPLARAPLLVLALGGGLVQLVLTLALHPPLLGPLALAWLAIGLASQDFFIPDLNRRPALSVGLHLTGLASAGLYAAGAGLFRHEGAAHPGLLAYMALTIAAGLGLELARKAEAPIDERPDIATYSRAWGPTAAGMGVGAAALATLVGATAAYVALGAYPGLLAPTLAMGAAGFLAATAFALRPSRAAADRMRLVLIVFVMVAFATIGFGPMALMAMAA